MKIISKRAYYTALLLVVSLVLISCRKKPESSIVPSELVEITTQPNMEVLEITEVDETKNEHIVAIDEDGYVWVSGDGNDDTNTTAPTEMKQETGDDISTTAQVPAENTGTDKKESTMSPQTEAPTFLQEETNAGSTDVNATPWG